MINIIFHTSLFILIYFLYILTVDFIIIVPIQVIILITDIY